MILLDLTNFIGQGLLPMGLPRLVSNNIYVKNNVFLFSNTIIANYPVSVANHGDVHDAIYHGRKAWEQLTVGPQVGIQSFMMICLANSFK